MAARVSRQVDGVHPRPAEIEYRSVVKALRIGPLDVMKRRCDEVAHCRSERAVTINVHQTLEAAKASSIFAVRIHARGWEEMPARDMIFMHVAVDDEIGAPAQFIGARDYAQRRIDDGGCVSALDPQGVAMRILAVLLADQHRHSTEPSIARTHDAP